MGPMVSTLSKSVADRAKLIYSSRLEADLEFSHQNDFVAIEPDSGEFFIADSFRQAVAAARKAYPDRLSFAIRAGNQPAIHMGAMTN